MKYLVVGLGNVGAEYAETRHNIGFKIVDKIANEEKASFELDKLAFVTQVSFKGRTIILIKPTTYMNLSGRAVTYWMQKEKIAPENVLILVDDLALPFGTIRMKKNGSDGGHNGLKSIQECLGHQNYSRIKFGIGNNFHKGKQVDYVLGEWSTEELKTLDERIAMVSEMVKSFTFVGMDKTMNLFNNK
jgi:peptidyl-tRNA hydrolase, PTH1 family